MRGRTRGRAHQRHGRRQGGRPAKRRHGGRWAERRRAAHRGRGTHGLRRHGHGLRRHGHGLRRHGHGLRRYRLRWRHERRPTHRGRGTEGRHGGSRWPWPGRHGRGARPKGRERGHGGRAMRGRRRSAAERLRCRGRRREGRLCVGVARRAPRRLRAVAPLARVLLHRLVDEVVDGALELLRHLLEGLPEHLAALEGPAALLVGISAHHDLRTARDLRLAAGKAARAASWLVTWAWREGPRASAPRAPRKT